jgi:hypothetical protein
MPLMHVCWIRKDGPKGVRVSAARGSETKERIPPSPPVQPIRTFILIIQKSQGLNLRVCDIVWLKLNITLAYNIEKIRSFILLPVP